MIGWSVPIDGVPNKASDFFKSYSELDFLTRHFCPFSCIMAQINVQNVVSR